LAFAVSYFKHFSRTLAHDLADKHSRTLSSTTPTIKTQDCPTPNSAQKKEKDAAKKRLSGDIATDGEARATPQRYPYYPIRRPDSSFAY